jgi:hypothetical protein
MGKAPSLWRWGYIVLVAALLGRLVYQGAAFASGGDDASAVPRAVRPGTELSGVALGHRTGGGSFPRLAFGTHKTTLAKLFSQQCGVLVFFESSCPVCRRIAERWRGLRRLASPGAIVPVVWVEVNRDDAGAGAFRREFDLGGDGIYVRSRRDLAEFGVQLVPIAYLLDRQGRLVRGGQTPEQLGSPPPACS